MEVGSSRCDDRAACSGAKLRGTQAVPPAARGRRRRNAASLPQQVKGTAPGLDKEKRATNAQMRWALSASGNLLRRAIHAPAQGSQSRYLDASCSSRKSIYNTPRLKFQHELFTSQTLHCAERKLNSRSNSKRELFQNYDGCCPALRRGSLFFYELSGVGRPAR